MTAVPVKKNEEAHSPLPPPFFSLDLPDSGQCDDGKVESVVPLPPRLVESPRPLAIRESPLHAVQNRGRHHHHPNDLGSGVRRKVGGEARV